MSHDDFAFEPTPGLPQPLPDGEWVVWRGAPDWRLLAVSALHVRKVAIYFGLLLAWTLAGGLVDGETLGAIALSALKLALLAAVALALLGLIAWLAGRSTVYTITNRRVVMRFGIALPMTVNIPFSQIQSAAMRLSRGDAGEICLALAPGQQFAYLLLWPHVRPWRLAHPMPMLRALADASTAAAHLRRALAADAGTVAAPLESTRSGTAVESFPLQPAVTMH